MKTRSFALLLAVSVFASLSGIASAAEIPDIGNSAVSIPWADFKTILEKLQGVTPPPPPPPPVDFALGRGALKGSLGGGRMEITAEYPLNVLKDDWVVCPLVYTGAPVADVLLDGKAAPVTDFGGQIALVLKGPSSHTLAIRFEVAAEMRPGPGVVSLSLPAGAGQVLSLAVGEKLSGVTVDGAVVRDAPGGISAVLTGNSLTVRYNVALEQAEQVEEKLPAKVLLENATLVSIDEGFVRAVAQLDYEVRHAPVTAFVLGVPEGFEVVDVLGASIAGWKVDSATRELTATIGYEVKGAYQLTVVLERSMEGEDFAFALPSLPAKGVERERGAFAVQVTGGVEVTPVTVKDLQPVDAKELPPGLVGGATNPVVLSYKYLRQPFAGELRVVRHKTQAVLGAAIDEANYVVQLTEDGDLVAGATYTVRNNRQQFLQITLPGGEKTALWSSFVSGKPVKPSRDKDGAILLPLEKSGASDGESAGFPVEIIYYAQIPDKLRVAGVLALDMPRVDLPISRSSLTVFAPPRFRYDRVGGSLREWEAVPVTTSVGLLQKADELTMLEDAAPAAAPMMEEAEISGGDTGVALGKAAGMSRSGRGAYGYAEKDVRQKKAEENFQQRLRAAQAAQDTGGAMPTRFTIPQAGSSMRYEELITIGEASNLKLAYWHAKSANWWHKLWRLVSFGFALWLALRARRILATAGARRFVLYAAALVAAAWLAAIADYAILGAVLGLGALFIAWVVGQVRVSRERAEAARTKP